MIHYAAPDFWTCYRALPPEIQKLADRVLAQLKVDPHHPSIHFKKASTYWSARVGLHYRALAMEANGGVLWFWIGSHAEYDRIVG